MFDYKKLGFKCGLEIHQQLETHKLFCNCPSLVNDQNKPNILITRKLRASAGETGEIDQAAKFEQQRDRNFVYEACSTSSCLVELDEEPPHELNKQALDVALQIALLLNCKIVDQIQIMRKIVVDGSNVSGFQRTALIAYDGYIETKKGRVSVPTICLEEESAKKIQEKDKEIYYRLDRLSVPLVEISTGTEIKDPEHAKEVAEYIGMVLRSTGKAKRGLGTIRQDVNISISGGARTEIKGFQDLRSIPKVIDNEIKRQSDLLNSNKKISPEVRKAEPDFTTSFLRPMPGSKRMYPETDVLPITITKQYLKSLEIPELILDRSVGLEEKYCLSAALAREIIKLNLPFDYYAEKYKLDPNTIAQILVEIPKEIKTRFNKDTQKLTTTDFELIFTNLESESITKGQVIDVIIDLIDKGTVNLSKYKVDDSELVKEIEKVIRENQGASFNALMGEVMKKFKGKIDGKKASEIIRKLI